jgi:hypothetical protein
VTVWNFKLESRHHVDPPPYARLIPSPIDQNRCAHWRNPRDPAATEDPILVFDAFGPIGFVMKFAADDWES